MLAAAAVVAHAAPANAAAAALARPSSARGADCDGGETLSITVARRIGAP